MKPDNKKRILVIEDENHIAEGLKLNLNIHGYSVKIAPDGVVALSMWKEFKPHLIVLDIMLPGIDGISVLRSIRLEDQRIPVLVLSAKGTPDDKIKGLILIHRNNYRQQLTWLFLRLGIKALAEFHDIHPFRS